MSSKTSSVNAWNPPPPPPRSTKPLEWWLTRTVVRVLLAFARLVPAGCRPALARGLGLACYHSLRRYRCVALKNLKHVFGEELSEQERVHLAKQVFAHLGLALLEFFLVIPGLRGERVEEVVRFEGREHFDRAFERGQGVIMVSGHYGNWEMMGALFAHVGYQVNAISREADDPIMNEMIDNVRRGRGDRLIQRSKALRPALQCLKRNEMLCILVDQNTAEGGIFVDFFGKPAATAPGAAYFAMKTGAAIVPAFCERQADGSHLVRARAPIEYTTTGDKDADARHIMSLINAALEDQIRRCPSQWMWIHDRWKLQPEDLIAPPPPAPGVTG